MRVFVQVKAWLLFLVMGVCPTACIVLAAVVRAPRTVAITLVVLTFGLAIGIPLAWVWSIGRRLHARAGATSSISFLAFNLSVLIQVAFWLSLAFGLPVTSVTVANILSWALPVMVTLAAGFCALFVVKRLSVAEQRDRGPAYLVGVGALVFLVPWLAVWVVQPRVNRIFTQAPRAA